MIRALTFLGIFLMGLPSAYAEGGSTVGHQKFLGPLRVSPRMEKLIGWVGPLARRLRDRTIVRVTNQGLNDFVERTQAGYLEVIVPAGVGHVWFRHGRELFDFGPQGFRVGGVRPINNERYGMLIRLTPEQETNLTSYLERLKQTGGAELGGYDFHGEKGFHCVTWMMRLQLDAAKGNLVKVLGGKERDGWSMPAFSRFLLRRASPVEAVIAYQNEAEPAKDLGTMDFKLMSSWGLRRAFNAAPGPSR